MSKSYYRDKLTADRLLRAYQLAPPRVKQYLAAEIDYVRSQIKNGDLVLELGCGYGRVLWDLAAQARLLVGIDTSLSSLHLATKSRAANCQLACMDAVELGFGDQSFDIVVCIQNGISAFHVDKDKLITEALRITRVGGIAFFSSYSSKFWQQRLAWFRLQAEAGLVGEIEEAETGGGRIVCKDGFCATTVGAEEFMSLTGNLNAKVELVEVDESSLFCRLTPL